MIYEFIATISAGFLMAGIALIIRHLTKLAGKTAPKWLIPIFAGIGMLGFQIHQEYNWQQQQIDRMPATAKVIKTVEGNTWFRPWSYLKPQVIRFMMVDGIKDVPSAKANNIKQVNIHLFERRMSTKIIPQFIDCNNYTVADPFGLNSIADKEEENGQTKTQNINIADLSWQSLDKDDELIKAVCTP